MLQENLKKIVPDMVSGKFVAELFGIKETTGQYTGNRSLEPAGNHVQGTLHLSVTVCLHLPAVYPDGSTVFPVLPNISPDVRTAFFTDFEHEKQI
jgi:hypothetical protein